MLLFCLEVGRGKKRVKKRLGMWGNRAEEWGVGVGGGHIELRFHGPGGSSEILIRPRRSQPRLGCLMPPRLAIFQFAEVMFLKRR